METIDVSAVRLAFESASTWSEWSTIAVAVGVFVELVALFVFSKEMPPLEKKVYRFDGSNDGGLVGCRMDLERRGRHSVFQHAGRPKDGAHRSIWWSTN
jgi:hypothetical protein